MTLDIGLVLLILLAALVLFVNGRMRMDLIALLVLAAVALTGLVGPADALAGFSNPAVVTVWAMFMLSAGLTVTGVADVIGRRILRLAGTGEVRLTATIVLTAAVLSAFMNNIGVAALMLPVTMEIARRASLAPSRLLLPLAYGSLLGGLTTLIGTPPNLLVADALREEGLETFRLFDFTPVGVVVALAGVAFLALGARRVLPARDIARETSGASEVDLGAQYQLEERIVTMRLAAGSPLIGRSLRGSRLGTATGLAVVAIRREGRTVAAPSPDFLLAAGDQLVVEGRLDRLAELRGWRDLIVERSDIGPESLLSKEVGVGELRLAEGSDLAGETIGSVGFRERFGLIVLAVRRGDAVLQREIADTPLRDGDFLFVIGRRERIRALARDSDFEPGGEATGDDLVHRYALEHRIFSVRVPVNSVLRFKSLAKSRLGDALGLGVLGIVRGGRTSLMPEPDERLLADDVLLVRGNLDDLEVFRGLQQLEIEEGPAPDLRSLESEHTGLAEVLLAPRSALSGRTLRDLQFRERYGLLVLAVLREGRAHRSNLRQMRLRLGDALLVFGGRDRIALLARDPDFLVIGQDRPVRRPGRAPLAGLIMAGVLVPVLAGWIPISIAAVAGAALMILGGCLTMEEAYRAIEWRSIFLIAGMLPLGTAMQQTGAAALLAEHTIGALAAFGAWGVVVGLYAVTALATLVIPTAALVVLVAPIALRAAADLGLSPQAVMMAVAIAASASFASPVSHPANLLVMGPGGYRFADYLRVGLPLTLLVMLVSLLVLPFVWPLQP